jgi:nucleotide-binding universal stress UspA family protein
MFKTILVPTDGSPQSDKAINAAIEFAQYNGSKIIGLAVADPYPFTPVFDGDVTAEANIYDEKMQERAQIDVQKIADLAQAANVPCETGIAQSFNPYEEIIKAAEESHCDIIFMASHGRKGLNKLFMGSETQNVLDNSTIPVLVFR